MAPTQLGVHHDPRLLPSRAMTWAVTHQPLFMREAILSQEQSSAFLLTELQEVSDDCSQTVRDPFELKLYHSEYGPTHTHTPQFSIVPKTDGEKSSESSAGTCSKSRSEEAVSTTVLFDSPRLMKGPPAEI